MVLLLAVRVSEERLAALEQMHASDKDTRDFKQQPCMTHAVCQAMPLCVEQLLSRAVLFCGL